MKKRSVLTEWWLYPGPGANYTIIMESLFSHWRFVLIIYVLQLPRLNYACCTPNVVFATPLSACCTCSHCGLIGLFYSCSKLKWQMSGCHTVIRSVCIPTSRMERMPCTKLQRVDISTPSITWLKRWSHCSTDLTILEKPCSTVQLVKDMLMLCGSLLMSSIWTPLLVTRCVCVLEL